MSENNGKRVALVTGANKGIGREVAGQLAKRGDTVLLGARDEERGRAAEADLEAEGFDAHFVHLDVEDAATHRAGAKFVAEKFGRLDVLVNNAGIALDADFKSSNVSQNLLRKTFDTNFFGVIAVTQAFLPLLKKSDAGRVVNVSSGLGSLTNHGDPAWELYGVKPLAYNSSKTALNAFTVMLAHELIPRPTSTPIAGTRPSNRERPSSSNGRLCRTTARRAATSTSAARCPGERIHRKDGTVCRHYLTPSKWVTSS